MSIQKKNLKILGLDISMNNVGACIAEYDFNTKKLGIEACQTFSPVKINDPQKKVRQISKDMHVLEQLNTALLKAIKKADLVFVELPTGSQTSRGAVAYGACLALIASIKPLVPLLIEVTPSEVKAVIGKKTATKKEVIEWVLNNYPSAPLTMYRGAVNVEVANHQADAIVTIIAGMRLPQFKALHLI